MSDDVAAILGSASQAATAARMMRARWLVAVSEGEATIPELMVASTRPGGEPLRKVRVDDLVCAAFDLRPARRHLVIGKMREYLDISDDVQDYRITVGWLLRNNTRNPDTQLHRLAGMLDAIDTSSSTRSARTSGFPFEITPNLTDVWK